MKALLLFTLALLPLSVAHASSAKVGTVAPDFTAVDTHGKTIKLSDLKGKPVVLEWTNHECPFVVKHYKSGNMQALQKETTADNAVTWISVVSSAKGKQGNVSVEDANKIISDQNAMPTHKILDESGEIGKLYDAKTTPHMFVIDKDGVLAYAGAIDDKSGFDPEEVKDAKNYVRAALANLKDGKPVEVSSTKPYGCGVKY
jgi:peroxiredoxin